MPFVKQALFACAPLVILLSAPAAASTATVIFVDASTEGANNGTSWRDAFIDLHDALAAAQVAGGVGVQIWVAAGEYLPGPADKDPMSAFHLVSGVAMYGGFAGWEISLDQRDWKANETILRRDLPAPTVLTGAPILTGENLGEGSILDGFIVRDGNNWPNTGPGALHLTESKFAIAHCTFEKNHTVSGSGGGAILAEYSTLTIVHTTFLSNKTAAAYGGAISVHHSTLDIKASTFLGNDGGYGGGALYLGNGATVTIEQCVVKNNNAFFDGGAVYSLGSHALSIKDSLFEANAADGPAVVAGNLVIENSLFRNNPGAVQGFGLITNSQFLDNVSSFHGGAIWGGPFEIDNCTFEGNSATFSGGAISHDGPNPLVIRNSRIIGNKAQGPTQGGGGIWSFDSVFWTPGPVTLINTIVDGNIAAGSGFAPPGGVHAIDLTMINTSVTRNSPGGVMIGPNGSAEIINSTIAHNPLRYDIQDAGLMIHESSHANVRNSVLWGNGRAGNSCDEFCGNSFVGCWCTEDCCFWGTCCPDKFEVCGGCEPPHYTNEMILADQINGPATASHSIIHGLTPGSVYDIPGANNLGDDPQFILVKPMKQSWGELEESDFRLQATSPAIDAGDNSFLPDPDEFPGIETDLDGNPRIIDGSGDGLAIVDLGAYEFQPSVPSIPGDLNGDGAVGVADLLILLTSWGPCANCDSPEDCPADFDGDCTVGVADLLILLANWG